MLTLTNNLDRTDEAVISNWPFTYDSTLDTGDGSLTADSFLAITVNVDESVVLPCRFKGVTKDGKLVVCDATGTEVCSGQLYETNTGEDISSFFLYNQYGVLCGSISCKSNVLTRLYSLSRFTDNIQYFAMRAFVFSPQCHVQSMKGQGRSLGVSGKYSVADLVLRCTTGVLVSGSSVSAHNVVPEAKAAITVDGTTKYRYAFSVYNIEKPVKNKWCRVYIQGYTTGFYNVEDCNLIFKSSVASNLRVVYSSDSITLRGVLDV